MTYTRKENGTLVPVEQPESIANHLHITAVYLSYELRDWSVFASMSGVPDNMVEESKKSSLHSARPPSSEIRLLLKNDHRELHSVREEGAAAIDGNFHFRINGNDNGATEGYIQHAPAWQSRDGLDGTPEAVYGGVSLPRDQFDWLLCELLKPNARLHVTLIAPIYKREIDMAFGQPWMRTEVFLPYDQIVQLHGFTFSVVHGAQMPPERQQPLAEHDDPTRDFNLPDESPPVEPTDHRLTWIVWLLSALVLIAGSTAWRLTH